MITGFEELTSEITVEEKHLMPLLQAEILCHSVTNPIKSPEILRRLNEYMNENNYNLVLTGPRLRKLINYARSNSLLPIIATSKGYYCSYERIEIKTQIESLEERSHSIQRCADGLKKFLSTNNI